MAIEKPSDPNVGGPYNTQGTGIEGTPSSQVLAPQYVAGQSSPSTGEIIPQNANQAASAPTPQASGSSSTSGSSGITSPTLPTPSTPTTRLGNVNGTPATPSLGSELAPYAPAAGAGLGAVIASPAAASSVGLGAVNQTAANLGIQSGINSLGSDIGGAFGGTAGTTAGTAAGTAATSGIDAVTTDAAVGAAQAAPMSIIGPTAGESVGSAAGSVAGGAVSGILGAALPGIGAGVATALTGGNLSQDVSAGIGATGGAELGSLIAGPIGGAVGAILGGMPVVSNFINNDIVKPVGNFVENDLVKPVENVFSDVGHFLGNIFCHAAGTLIRMANGTRKTIEDIRMGDKVLLGGLVIGRGEVLGMDAFHYRGTVVSGRHAVFDVGHWLRVEDTEDAEKLPLADPIPLYPLVTQNHLLVTEQYICADFAETDDNDMAAGERLAKLNAMERNRYLVQAERILAATHAIERSAA